MYNFYNITIFYKFENNSVCLHNFNFTFFANDTIDKNRQNYGTLNTKTANILKYLGDSLNNKTFLISQNKFSIIINKIIENYKKTSNYSVKISTLDSAPQIILPSVSVLVIVLLVETFGLLNASYLVDVSMITFSLYRLLPLLSSIYGSHLKLLHF